MVDVAAVIWKDVRRPGDVFAALPPAMEAADMTGSTAPIIGSCISPRWARTTRPASTRGLPEGEEEETEEAERR